MSTYITRTLLNNLHLLSPLYCHQPYDKYYFHFATEEMEDLDITLQSFLNHYPCLYHHNYYILVLLEMACIHLQELIVKFVGSWWLCGFHVNSLKLATVEYLHLEISKCYKSGLFLREYVKRFQQLPTYYCQERTFSVSWNYLTLSSPPHFLSPEHLMWQSSKTEQIPWGMVPASRLGVDFPTQSQLQCLAGLILPFLFNCSHASLTKKDTENMLFDNFIIMWTS